LTTHEEEAIAIERLASSLQPAADDEIIATYKKIIATSGNHQLDRYLGKALVRLADTFDINPGFGFMYDARPNAYADPNSRIPGTQGTVLLVCGFSRRL
jgi:hypothetical protein